MFEQRFDPNQYRPVVAAQDVLQKARIMFELGELNGQLPEENPVIMPTFNDVQTIRNLMLNDQELRYSDRQRWSNFPYFRTDLPVSALIRALAADLRGEAFNQTNSPSELCITPAQFLKMLTDLRFSRWAKNMNDPNARTSEWGKNLIDQPLPPGSNGYYSLYLAPNDPILIAQMTRGIFFHCETRISLLPPQEQSVLFDTRTDISFVHRPAKKHYVFANNAPGLSVTAATIFAEVMHQVPWQQDIKKYATN